jgi:hypothetical protein
MSSSRFVEPKNKKIIVEKTPEALRRKKLAYDKISRKYILNKTTDKAQIITSIYAQKYPNNVRRNLMTLCRAKIKPHQFEINDNLDIQTDGKVTECLVYGVSVYVDHPNDIPGTNVLASCREVHGVYQRPYAQISRDDLGNVTSSEVKYWTNMFYIPFTEHNVKKVLEEFNGEYRDLALGYAREVGNRWYGDRVFEVSNMQEYLSASFEDVIAACQDGFLKSTEPGGVDLYLKDKQDKRKKRETEIEEFRKTNDSSNTIGSSNKSKS